MKGRDARTARLAEAARRAERRALAASSVLGLQEFAEFFEAQPRPRRLVGFSKRGTVHYATPGAAPLLLHLP